MTNYPASGSQPDPSGYNHPEGYTPYGENQSGSTAWQGYSQADYSQGDYQAQYGQTGYGQSQYGQSQYGDSTYGQQYGQQPYTPGFGAQAAPVEKNNLAVVGLILGILGLLTSLLLPWIGGPLAIAAIVLGVMGMRRSTALQNANPGYPADTKRGMSIASIVLGALGTLIAAAVFAFTMWIVTQIENSDLVEKCEQYINDDAALQECVERELGDNPNFSWMFEDQVRNSGTGR